jgi:hypothetical protein
MSRQALERDSEAEGYDALALESGIVSCIVGERSEEGADISELMRDLEINPRFKGAPRRAIEDAVRRLVDGRLLRMDGERVLPGPLFGSSVTADSAPSRN